MARTIGTVSWVFLLALASCANGKGYIEDRNWTALSQVVHNRLINEKHMGQLSPKQVDQLLIRLHVEKIQINDLSELRNVYSAAYVEPQLDDEITEAIDRLIGQELGTRLWLETEGKRYPPTAVYVIVDYDRTTYQAQLENTYADDSIHIPEFPESFGDKNVTYNREKAIRVHVESPLQYIVHPHYYQGHSWTAINLEMDTNGTLKMPGDMSEYVMFAIVAVKGISNREYKGIWVLEK